MIKCHVRLDAARVIIRYEIPDERHQIKAHVRRASLDRSPDSSSRQLHAKGVVETIGPVRLPYGGS